jgi:large subunit ribosomal protein L3
VRILVYSQSKKTGIKKVPDLSEIGLTGTIDEKINFIKENIGKEMSVLDFFERGQLVDLRGLTKGKGFSGPVKRFGITLKSHKSEKGRRRPGSLGPWHPARVTFRAPQAGQLGMFTRVIYNNKVLDLGKAEDKFKNMKNYGDVNNDYVIVAGSVQGPVKRQLLITAPLRETKKQSKKNFEFLGIIR